PLVLLDDVPAAGDGDRAEGGAGGGRGGLGRRGTGGRRHGREDGHDDQAQCTDLVRDTDHEVPPGGSWAWHARAVPRKPSTCRGCLPHPGISHQQGSSSGSEGGTIRPVNPSMVRRLAVIVGAVSTALMVCALLLLFIDRHASVPAGVLSWKFSTVLDQAVNLGTPALGVL